MNLSGPLGAFWESTDKCNLSCKHCYTSSSPQGSRPVSFDAACKIVDKLFESGVSSLAIGGGEPLALPYLQRLVKYATSKGMYIAISTNGLLLTERKLDGLIQSGLRIIQVSVDGLRADHEELRGQGNYDRAIKAIERIISAELPFRVGSVVHSRNYSRIEQFANLMRDTGVPVVNFFRYMPTNGNIDLSLDSRMMKEASGALMRLYRQNVYGGSSSFYVTFEPISFFSFLIDRQMLGKTKCTAGLAKFNIDQDWNVSACNYVQKKSGNIGDSSISELWREIQSERVLINTAAKECQSCEWVDKCRGGCAGFRSDTAGGYSLRDQACFKELVA